MGSGQRFSSSRLDGAFGLIEHLHGQEAAARILQRTLCALGSIVEETGVVDPSTIRAAYFVPDDMLLPRLKKEFNEYGQAAKT